jgi:hypothetical protein
MCTDPVNKYYRSILDVGATQLPGALQRFGVAVAQNAWPRDPDIFVESVTIGVWLAELMILINKFGNSGFLVG